MAIDVAGIPKAELHCHVGLAMTADMLREAQRRGMEIAVTPEEFEALLPVKGWAGLSAVNQALRSLRDLEKPAFYHLTLELLTKRLAAEGAVYAELGLGFITAPAWWLDPEPYRTYKRIVDAHSGDGLHVEMLLSPQRGPLPPEVFAEAVPFMVRLFEEGLIVGVSWIGLEKSSMEPFAKSNAALRAAGLGISVHAGELAGPDSVRDALRHAQPSRLGHGLAAFRDPELLAQVRDADIHLELCPTSNVRLDAVSGIDAHPLRTARELGMNFSINTDDPGIFQCTLSSEYQLAADTLGFTQDDLRKATANALRSRFLRYDERR